jgi:hypothetical protein
LDIYLVAGSELFFYHLLVQFFKAFFRENRKGKSIYSLIISAPFLPQTNLWPEAREDFAVTSEINRFTCILRGGCTMKKNEMLSFAGKWRETKADTLKQLRPVGKGEQVLEKRLDQKELT